MLKGGIAAFVLSVVLAGACHAGPEYSDDVAALPESVRAQARWAKAERDRANAVLAKDFVRGKNASESPRRIKALQNVFTGGQPVK